MIVLLSSYYWDHMVQKLGEAESHHHFSKEEVWVLVFLFVCFSQMHMFKIKASLGRWRKYYDVVDLTSVVQ